MPTYVPMSYYQRDALALLLNQTIEEGWGNRPMRSALRKIRHSNPYFTDDEMREIVNLTSSYANPTDLRWAAVDPQPPIGSPRPRYQALGVPVSEWGSVGVQRYDVD